VVLENFGRRPKKTFSTLSAKSGLARLFDYLISSSAYRLCDRQAKRLGGLQIDDQLKSGGLINWNVARFCPVEDLVHVIGETLGEFAEIGRISHQPTQVHIVAVRITDRETVFLGQFNDQYSLRQKSASFVNDYSLELFLRYRIGFESR
jgi:hypothetical protein